MSDIWCENCKAYYDGCIKNGHNNKNDKLEWVIANTFCPSCGGRGIK